MYSLVRIIINLVVALIFGSAYPQQTYSSYISTVSRGAVIFITSLFCSILAMVQVQPILGSERTVFYREQQSRMYAVWIYTVSLVIIEVMLFFLVHFLE